MRKFVRITATSIMAVAAIVPATANAAGNDLRGAPTLRCIDAHHARLQFATDEHLVLRNGSSTDLRIAFSGGQRVSSIVASGRHGDDYRYTAQISSQTEFRSGAKYTVRFRFGRQQARVRRVKLHCVLVSVQRLDAMVASGRAVARDMRLSNRRTTRSRRTSGRPGAATKTTRRTPVRTPVTSNP